MIKKTLLLIASLLCLSNAVAGEKEWIDSVISTLSLREQVAQLFVPHLIIRDNAKGREAIRHYVEGDKVGGILMGESDITDYANLNAYAQSLADIPLMITADAEWGNAMRLKDAVRFPKNIALGASNDLKLMEEYGREIARQCQILGISVDFAPVVDVNSNPDNPVIGPRSFGEDPQRVADLAAAVARGMKQGGVVAVAKHFPGHGDTATDSHQALPVIDKTQSQLDLVELVPYRKVIPEGIDGVMIGHINVPRLDPSGAPASLSKAVITDLLKNTLGFENLVFTDALEMKGAQKKNGESNCIDAFNAGADVLLCSTSPSKDIDAVVAAIKSGKISKDRLDESLRKILKYKYRLDLSTLKPYDAEAAIQAINSPEALDLNRRLSAASIVILRDDNNVLPIGPFHHAALSLVGAKTEGNLFAEQFNRLNKERPALEADADTLMIAGVFSFKQESVDRLAALKKRYGQKLVPVFFINPYKVKAFAKIIRDLPALVIVGDDSPGLRRAAADAVFGAAPVDGRMSVSVEGVCSSGEGVSRQQTVMGEASAPTAMAKEIDALVEQGLKTGAFTGCQVMVIKDGNIVYENNSGFTDTNKKHAVTENTLFDLASVSKCVGTLASLMAAYDSQLIALDDSIAKFILPLRGDGKGRLTVRELMFHETGLPSGLNVYKAVLDTATYDGPVFRKKRGEPYTIAMPEGLWGNSQARLRTDLYSENADRHFSLPVAKGLYTSEAARDSIYARIYATEASQKKSYKYSDLNFCLLQQVCESATDTPMPRWLNDEVSSLLGNDRTLYLPLRHYPATEIAATEQDNFLRHQKLHGYVHDETAAFSGGIQGNAGLFSNAEGVARWCQMLLNKGLYGGSRLLEEATVDTFLTTRSASGRRGLGFDVSGTFIGHKGYTGTCFWLDPQRQLTVVILTNRVNPTRDNKAWSALRFREAILDLVSATY